MPHRQDSKETSYRIRATLKELAEWHAAAAKADLSLADFIRAGIVTMNTYGAALLRKKKKG